MTCVLFSHARYLHARFKARLKENTTLKCGVSGAFGVFGLINLVLQTVLLERYWLHFAKLQSTNMVRLDRKEAEPKIIFSINETVDS